MRIFQKSSCYLMLAMMSMLPACSSIGRQEHIQEQIVLVISVPEQSLSLVKGGQEQKRYSISTAKNGVGDIDGSYMTPSGKMSVAEKHGAGLPSGSVLKDRVPTGEIVGVDAPGRDPIVSRILWLRGLEERNRHAYDRFIYIHGTPQESALGTPASFGCIRMRSNDVLELFDQVPVGSIVWVMDAPHDAIFQSGKLLEQALQ